MKNYIQKGIEHQAAEVKGAAIKCLCYFAEFLCPDILVYHKIIIPALLNNLNIEQPIILQKTLISLQTFADNMNKEILEHLSLMMNALKTIIVHPNVNQYYYFQLN